MSWLEPWTTSKARTLFSARVLERGERLLYVFLWRSPPHFPDVIVYTYCSCRLLHRKAVFGLQLHGTADFVVVSCQCKSDTSDVAYWVKVCVWSYTCREKWYHPEYILWAPQSSLLWLSPPRNPRQFCTLFSCDSKMEFHKLGVFQGVNIVEELKSMKCQCQFEGKCKHLAAGFSPLPFCRLSPPVRCDSEHLMLFHFV